MAIVKCKDNFTTLKDFMSDRGMFVISSKGSLVYYKDECGYTRATSKESVVTAMHRKGDIYGV